MAENIYFIQDNQGGLTDRLVKGDKNFIAYAKLVLDEYNNDVLEGNEDDLIKLDLNVVEDAISLLAHFNYYTYVFKEEPYVYMDVQDRLVILHNIENKTVYDVESRETNHDITWVDTSKVEYDEDGVYAIY